MAAAQIKALRGPAARVHGEEDQLFDLLHGCAFSSDAPAAVVHPRAGIAEFSDHAPVIVDFE